MREDSGSVLWRSHQLRVFRRSIAGRPSVGLALRWSPWNCASISRMWPEHLHPPAQTQRCLATRGASCVPYAPLLTSRPPGTPRDLLERGGWGGGGPEEGGRGSGGEPPPLGTYAFHQEQNYWAVNHSAHGNGILSVVTKANLLMQSMQGTRVQGYKGCRVHSGQQGHNV